ncbi:MAG: glycosyltransferase family 4 protein [Synechococcaceae cyanobacterium ELA445]
MRRPARLVVLITHPVQYFKPVFAALAAEADLELLVLFGCDHGVRSSLDPDFGVEFAWDSAPTEGFPHAFLSKRPLPDLSRWGVALPLALEAVRRVRSFRPDGVLVFAYSPAFITLTTLLLAATGQHLLLRADGTDRAFPRSALKSASKDGLLRAYYTLLRHVFPIGSDSDDHFRRLGVPASRRTPVPYAIDVDYFAAQVERWLPRREQLRAQENLPPERVVLLWAGKITAVKNPGLLVEALALLPEAVRLRLALVVVGDGPLRQEFERRLEPLLPGRCRFAGFRNQSEMGRFHALADALVFPSRQGETWGLVVNEALQFGLPVLVSDHAGCARDLVAPDAHPPAGSAVFPSGNPRALAAALERLLEQHDPTRLRQPMEPLPHPGDLARAVATVVRGLVPAQAASHSASTTQRQ